MSEQAFSAVDSHWLVPRDGRFRIKQARTTPPRGAEDDARQTAALHALTGRLDTLQHILHAHDRRALLLVFQAMDAAGKDSTIRAVLSGVDPAGCVVHAFKKPGAEELDHDFLWRAQRRLPERGQIGVFNRSHYESVLIERVHPEQISPGDRAAAERDPKRFWAQRYESIRDWERHLARNGTVILKFFLNVSKEEQRRRLLARLEVPEKNWKFQSTDVAERPYWGDYQRAYQDALNETSRPWAPWYAIPADSKPFMRRTVAGLIVDTLEKLGLEYPAPGKAERATFAALRRKLQADR